MPRISESETHLEQIDSFVAVPVFVSIGAAKSYDDIPIREWIDIPRPSWAKDADVFRAAKVNGESLYDDSIHDGDYVVFRITFEQYEVTPGTLVAVFTPYGLLIKHIYFTLDKRVRLVSSNPTYEDIVLDADDVTVQGIAEELVRRLRR